jgi:hypothetical protein
MTYPENAIKGIPNKDYFDQNGVVNPFLYYFNPIADRGDGWAEQSINWHDNESAIELTIRQTKENGEVQFKGGVVLIPRLLIDDLKDRPAIKGLLSYDRQPIIGNPFHGNLLLHATTSKTTMKLIAAGLTLTISKCIPSVEEITD